MYQVTTRLRQENDCRHTEKKGIPLLLVVELFFVVGGDGPLSCSCKAKSIYADDGRESCAHCTALLDLSRHGLALHEGKCKFARRVIIYSFFILAVFIVLGSSTVVYECSKVILGLNQSEAVGYNRLLHIIAYGFLQIVTRPSHTCPVLYPGFCFHCSIKNI